ncbi:MAG TPA: nucleotidyltransferase domain-containing protein [Candidatus Goldiibacteriota bacterium]|jgi:predicted nucleotidyltransferase|nr:nucleotidyltransferase domain-containing protein [Candidatus Goldiibacteriota bacterium]HRQ45009.1 nucleotidyltransferase domain-containing protein [Candidatus Goldiibacteriota bacterium]
MNPQITEITNSLRGSLSEIYGDKLHNVLLYGSYARGTQTEGSDIDIAVVLKGDIFKTAEINRMLDIVTDLNLKYNVLVSVYPVSEQELVKVNSPILINLRQEGIAVGQ